MFTGIHTLYHSMIIFGVILCFPMILQADPWGKDADLASLKHRSTVSSCKIQTLPPQHSVLALIGGEMIRFHQEVISPADGPRSHFIPSSSQYTLDAMRKYGFFRGYAMGCDRLMRENDDPWVYKKVLGPAGNLMKWNPVP